MPKIIIAEDDTELRDSLSDYLTECNHQVTGVGSAIEFYQNFNNSDYDIAILDVNLPHYDGLSVASHLSENSDVAIIVMTVQGAVQDRVRGYQAGADLYLVKPVDCEELAAAVETLSKRRAKLRVQSEAPKTMWQLNVSQFKLTAPTGRAVDLTRKEVRVMEFISAQSGVIVSRADLMQFLDQDKSSPDSRALDAAVSRLRNKVQHECGVTLPLQTVQNTGYVFAGDIRAL